MFSLHAHWWGPPIALSDKSSLRPHLALPYAQTLVPAVPSGAQRLQFYEEPNAMGGPFSGQTGILRAP